MAQRRTLGALGGVALYLLAIRPALLHSGATKPEIWRPYPGAEIVPGGRRGATMATTVAAPPARVWPWLVQMGCDRAGWYSWDRLDNGGVPSAARIHPEWQHLEVGDRLAAAPKGNVWFEVAAIEPERFLALRASFDVRGRPYDPRGRRPRAFSDSVWCFLLEELPGERTRLVVGGYTAARPRIPALFGDLVFWEPAHWVMQVRQLANLRRLAEGTDTVHETKEADDVVALSGQGRS